MRSGLCCNFVVSKSGEKLLVIALGRETTFQALRAFLDPINTQRLPLYEEVAAQLEVSVGSLKTQIHRLRKQYAATIGEEISRTVSDPADVETETHELCEALIAAEGWVMLNPDTRGPWRGTL
jgi:hypothetical protein